MENEIKAPIISFAELRWHAFHVEGISEKLLKYSKTCLTEGLCGDFEIAKNPFSHVDLWIHRNEFETVQTTEFFTKSVRLIGLAIAKTDNSIKNLENILAIIDRKKQQNPALNITERRKTITEVLAFSHKIVDLSAELILSIDTK